MVRLVVRRFAGKWIVRLYFANGHGGEEYVQVCSGVWEKERAVKAATRLATANEWGLEIR